VRYNFSQCGYPGVTYTPGGRHFKKIRITGDASVDNSLTAPSDTTTLPRNPGIPRDDPAEQLVTQTSPVPLAAADFPATATLPVGAVDEAASPFVTQPVHRAGPTVTQPVNSGPFHTQPMRRDTHSLASSSIGTMTQPLVKETPEPRARAGIIAPRRELTEDNSVTETVNRATLPIRGDGRGSLTSSTLAAPATAPPPAPTTPEEPCPRCASKLVDPESLGWCPKCGYCRSLEAEAAKKVLQESPAAKPLSRFGYAEFFDMVAKLPRWCWVLLGGIVIIAIASVGLNLALPTGLSFARALCSTAALVIGLLAILAAQVWALIIIAPDDDHLGFKDAIISARLWGLTIRRLPTTERQVWIGCWGAASALCAVLIVGGLPYWYQFYKPKKIAGTTLLQAVSEMSKDTKEGAENLEKAVSDFADKQDLTKKKTENPNEPDTRSTVQCVVIGYTLDSKKQIDSLLLATLVDEKLQYVGSVYRGFSPEDSKELLRLLGPLESPTPLIRGVAKTAVWVKPKIFCDIHQSGFSKDGQLVKPTFAALLTEK
jgi:ATP dependent DNA ligase C terminal region